MKKRVMIIAGCTLLLAFATVFATSPKRYAEIIRYWYSQNIGSDVPPLYEIVSATKTAEHGMQFSWLIDNPPSKTTLDAIDEEMAIAWALEDEKTRTANFNNWSPREKAAILVLLDEIDELRSELGLPAKTAAERKAAIKTKLP
jgi:hypothetical protein